jgi:hypothetical protein
MWKFAAWAGIVLVLSACATGGYVTSSGRVRSTTCDFGAKIAILPQKGFNLENNGYSGKDGPYVAPKARQINWSVGPEKDYGAQLIDAYSKSPDFLKARLCDLTAVFIDTSRTVNGWGFWENPSPDGREPQPGNRTFVAISSNFLKAHSSLQSNEDSRIINLTDYNGQFSSDGDFTATLIGVFAHEIAHILWVYDAETTKIIVPSLRACGPFANSWKHSIERGKPLVIFNDPDNDPKPRKVKAIKDGADKPEKLKEHFGRAGDKVKRWASVFAAVSPIEDFAETYRLYALTSRSSNQTSPLPVQTLELTGIPMSTIDVVADIKDSSTDLAGKKACIAAIDGRI